MAAQGQRTRIDMGSLTGGKSGGATAKGKVAVGNANAKKAGLAVALFALAGAVYFLNPFGGRSERSTGGALTMGGGGDGATPAAPAPANATDEDVPTEDPNAQMPHPPLGPHLIHPEEDPDMVPEPGQENPPQEVPPE